VKQISSLIVGFAAALAVSPALAEDFTAGKTPAQLFRSDCGACHHSPNGLARERDNVSGLIAFLREHYTTKSESAAALAAYVAGFAPAARGRAPAGPGRRSRTEDDAPVTTAGVPAEVKPADVRPADDTAAPARRRRARDDGDAPRPPRGVATSPGSSVPQRVSQPADAADPIARLRDYLSSGLDSSAASAQAERSGMPPSSPRGRKRSGDDAVTAGAPPAAAAPAAETPPAPRADAPAEPPPAETR
jgi:hypothetical protein